MVIDTSMFGLSDIPIYIILKQRYHRYESKRVIFILLFLLSSWMC